MIEPPDARRRVLVTGATGPVGQAIARRLAAEGLFIGLHYHTRETEACTGPPSFGGSHMGFNEFQDPEL